MQAFSPAAAPLLPDGALARADLAACRRLLRGGSRSFFAASLLLPAKVSGPAAALYGFCRLADDAVDVDGGHAVALARLRGRLARAYAGKPLDIPADRAFARVVAQFGVPRALPEALLEGLAWDVEGRRYETLADLRAYAMRVAGAVGAMMAIVMGTRDVEALARACDLGVAMQLTNIARDVGEDARTGRLYLPLAWLREAGIDLESFMARPVFSRELGTVVARLLAEAADLYARAEPGIALLPASCRPGIHAARLIYAAIGEEVARMEYDSISRRAAVSSRRKAALILRAAAAAVSGRPRVPAPPLPEAQSLVHAVTAASALHPRRRGFGERLVWVVDLFERLAREEALQRGRP